MRSPECLTPVALFCRVCECRSLRSAARELGLSSATLERLIAALEHALGAPLFSRNVRGSVPTPEGQALYEQCSEQIQLLEQTLVRMRQNLRGAGNQLSIGTNLSLACAVVLPCVQSFLAARLDVCIEVLLHGSEGDLLDGAPDLQLVEGDLPDSEMITRSLAQLPRRVVVAPDYLERAALPTTIEELRGHEVVLLSGEPRQWRFKKDGTEVAIDVTGRLTVDTTLAAREAVRNGIGLGLLPAYLADPMIRSRALLAVPLDAEPVAVPLSAVYAQRRRRDRLLRDVLQALKVHLTAK
jgi:DNA-binding transcriptional LysR family regulator